MVSSEGHATEASELARQYSAALGKIKALDRLFREAGPKLQNLAEALSAKDPGGGPILISPAVVDGGIGREFGDQKFVDDVILNGQSLRSLVGEFQEAKKAKRDLGSALQGTDFADLVAD